MTGAAVDEEDELVLDFCRLAGGAVEAEVDIFLKNFEEAGGIVSKCLHRSILLDMIEQGVQRTNLPPPIPSTHEQH
jgi:hypothetical protein